MRYSEPMLLTILTYGCDAFFYSACAFFVITQTIGLMRLFAFSAPVEDPMLDKISAMINVDFARAFFAGAFAVIAVLGAISCECKSAAEYPLYVLAGAFVCSAMFTNSLFTRENLCREHQRRELQIKFGQMAPNGLVKAKLQRPSQLLMNVFGESYAVDDVGQNYLIQGSGCGDSECGYIFAYEVKTLRNGKRYGFISEEDLGTLSEEKPA